MKKFILVALLSLVTTDFVNAQAVSKPDTSDVAVVRSASNLKTGNTLDVLTNFFQLALKDLGGKDKSFAFKSTLFGIKAKVDSTLLVDTAFRKQRFARNLQFEVALHTNDNFKPVGISGGITYALINNRDKQRADFRHTLFRETDSVYKAARKKADNVYLMTIQNDPQKLLEFTQVMAGFDTTGDITKLPKELQDQYKKDLLPGLWKASQAAYDSAMANWAARGLLTVSLNARTDSSSTHFREGNLDFAYLKGLGGRSIEADLRAGINGKDTLTPDGNYRFTFHAQGGANFIVFASQKTHKSLLELKPNVEFISVISKQYAGQENFFSFNMDVRLRVTDQIWIPFIVKYDIQNHNFLGFLNVSVNMDAFKGALKGGGQ